MKTISPSHPPAEFVSQHQAIRTCFALAGIALLTATFSLQAAVPSAVRELPYDFHPGDLIQVRLQVTPPVGTTNWTIRERYPDRWDFVSSTNASPTNEFTGELIFGPFANDTARTLSYEVASIPGLTNSVSFTGQIVFNGATNPVAGTTFLPARNEWLFDGPQSVTSQVGISGVTYGAGRWLASSFGWITTLESGGRLTYPRGLRFHGEGSSRLAYVGGLFLLFGSGPNGAQMTVSDDGITWKNAQREAGDTHPDPFAQTGAYLESVAYGNGVHVAVGEHYYSSEESQWAGAIFRSTNGYNWRRVFRLLTPSRHINAVAFANNRFLAVADAGTLLTSTNGLDWAETQPITGSVSTNRNLLGICYGPAGWIIPASALPSDASLGTVLRSADGETWTQLTGTSSGNNLYWQSFYADGKYWFSGYTGGALTTADGTAWTLVPTSPASLVGPVNRAPDGVTPQYLAAGANYGSLVSSTNGSNWTVTVPSGSARWPRYLSVASFSNECVISGQSANPVGGGGREYPTDSRPPYIWIPNLAQAALNVRNSSGQWRKENFITAYADLLSATNRVLAAGARRDQLRADVLTGTNYAVSVTTLLPDLNRVVPVQYWKYVGPNFVGPEYVNASLTKTPTGYDLFAETYYASRIRWGHFTSTNGSAWSRRTAGLNHATNFPGIRSLAWGAGRFVAVSEGSSPGTSGLLTSTNRIYTSTDGENYLPVNLSTLAPGLIGEGLTGVAYGDGKFVAIGNAGQILSSTNGLDWETVRASDGRRWNRVRFLNGVWAIVGNAGWLAFSLDGRTWASRTAGAESDLTDIAHQNGSYMVVGSHAMVLLSQPVTPATIQGDTLTKLPGAGLQFNVSGHPGKVLDIQSGSNLVNWTSLLRRTNTTGTTVITDPEPNQARRFYRAVQQP